MNVTQFIKWLNQTAGRGFYCMGQPCWRIKGILLTLWFPKDCAARLKIYYNGGRSTISFDILGELCREHIYELLAQVRGVNQVMLNDLDGIRQLAGEYKL
jgi:hypothetical protein